MGKRKAAAGALEFFSELIGKGRVAPQETVGASDHYLTMLPPSRFHELAAPIEGEWKESLSRLIEDFRSSRPLDNIPMLSVDTAKGDALRPSTINWMDDDILRAMRAKRWAQDDTAMGLQPSDYTLERAAPDIGQLWDERRTHQQIQRALKDGTLDEWLVSGHEGRNRAKAWQEVFGDEPMPVIIYDKSPGRQGRQGGFPDKLWSQGREWQRKISDVLGERKEYPFPEID